MKKLTIKDLKLVVHTLNVLCKDSNKTKGVELNTIHFSRFHNDTHYIDYNEKRLAFGVYKKYDGFFQYTEKLSKNKKNVLKHQSF